MQPKNDTTERQVSIGAMGIHGLIAVCGMCGAEDGGARVDGFIGASKPMPAKVRGYLTPNRWRFDEHGHSYGPNGGGSERHDKSMVSWIQPDPSLFAGQSRVHLRKTLGVAHSVELQVNRHVRRRRLSTISVAAAGQALVNPRNGPKSLVAAKPVM